MNLTTVRKSRHRFNISLFRGANKHLCKQVLVFIFG